MGGQGEQLQVLFITVDPERDTLPLLKAYMANFDPTFLALRPEPAKLPALAERFKIRFDTPAEAIGQDIRTLVSLDQ